MDFNEIETPEQLLIFMKDNISYGYVSHNNEVYRYGDPRISADNWPMKYRIPTGEEVLKHKLGTCWCQVELEREWFKRHNYNYQTYFMWFELERNNQAATHTFLTYELDKNYYWFENSWDTYYGIHKYSSKEEMLEDIKKKHIAMELENKHISEEEINKFAMYKYEDVPYGGNGYDFTDAATDGEKVIFNDEEK